MSLTLYNKKQATANVQHLLPIYIHNLFCYTTYTKQSQICHTYSACWEDLYGPAHQISILHTGGRIGLGLLYACSYEHISNNVYIIKLMVYIFYKL
jgi:hypothetical protein